MIIFNLILLLILDFYIFFAVRGSRLSFGKKKWFALLWWGYSTCLALGVFASYQFNIPLSYRSIILVVFFMTAICKFLYVIILLIDDIRRGSVWIGRLFNRQKKQIVPIELPKENSSSKISRSDFLLKSGIVVASLPLFPLSWGILSGAHDYQVRRQKLILPNLPKEFHGLKIAQVSDVHSGSFYNKKAVLGGVEMLLAEKPDAIFFTGDLVNHVSSEMRDYQDIFSKLKANFGVFSILGNHDYGDYHYGFEDSPAKRKNFQDMLDVHKAMGWTLLRDENRIIRMGQESIAIVGVENWGAGLRFPKKGDLKKALTNTEEQSVRLLLSHDPSHWRAQVLESTADVMFAGHTHGMQFGVRTEHFQWSPVQYLYKEWAGLYKEEDKQLYVNTGFGFLGYPGRVGIVPEITVFELVKG